MTNQEINIAIAEACGWEDVEHSNAPTEFNRRPVGMKRDGTGARTPLEQIPNYVGSLDAMAVAWDTLTQDQKLMFYKQLWQIVLRDLTILTFEPCNDKLLESYTANATARQRAEVFLKTINQWKE